MHGPFSASHDEDMSVAESASGLECMSASASSPDTSTGLAYYGTPIGSFRPSNHHGAQVCPYHHRIPAQHSSKNTTPLRLFHSLIRPTQFQPSRRCPSYPLNLPLTLRLPCTPPYEPLPLLLAHASGGGGMSKKMEKKLRKEAELEAQAIAY